MYSTYNHFRARPAVDSLVMTEELLDTALAKQCTNFQPTSHAKLQVLVSFSFSPLSDRNIIPLQD